MASDLTTYPSYGQYRPRPEAYYHDEFGGYNNFMASFGLNPWNLNDKQEAKAIIEGFRRQDKYTWEQEQLAKQAALREQLQLQQQQQQQQQEQKAAKKKWGRRK